MSKRTIEEYRAIVAARPQSRGTARISRHQHLMNQKTTRPQRRTESTRFKGDYLRVEAEHNSLLHLIRTREVSFRGKQVEYDEAAGKYRSRTFLESALRQRGIESEEEIEDMMEQYRLSKHEKPMAAVAEGSPIVNFDSWDDLLGEEE